MTEIAASIKTKLIQDIIEQDKELLTRIPISRHLAYLSDYPEVGPYSYTSVDIQKDFEVLSKYQNTTSKYQKLILLELIEKNSQKIKQLGLPDTIASLFEINFKRIIDDIQFEKQSEDFYHFKNDKFLKDISLCNLRLTPAGAQKLNLTKFPILSFRSAGLVEFAKIAAFSTFNRLTGGCMYDMHTDSHDADLLNDFTPAGWRQFYINVADLLMARPDIKGLFGVGWFFDPKVSEISPRLSYLRDLVIESGGSTFNAGENEGATSSALAKSETRKRAYQQGIYKPLDYLVIWDRSTLIDWRQKQK